MSVLTSFCKLEYTLVYNPYADIHINCPFILQLLLHPESDDSAQLSQIETEKLLAELVEAEINKRLVRYELLRMLNIFRA